MEQLAAMSRAVNSSVTGDGAACTPFLTFMSLVLARIQGKAEGEKRAEATRTILAEEFDMVIVGGGAAGCVLAARLSEWPNWNILLLERGGSEPSEAHVPGFADINRLSSFITQSLESVPQPGSCEGAACTLQVGRVLGGGTTVNEMLFVRGNHEDYNSWAKITNDDGWRYDNVLPYFKKLEDTLNPKYASDVKYHGTRGPLPVSQLPYQNYILREGILPALGAIGLKEIDTNAATQLGYMPGQSQAKGGERWSTNRAYLQPSLRRGNLEVRTFANVTRVLFEETASNQKPRAVGVEYVDAAGRTRTVNARLEVVLSAGALHTPQILMRSGVGPANHLREAGIEVIADLPVGDNLQDHVCAYGLDVYCRNCTPPGSDWDYRLRDILLYDTTGPPSPSRQGPLASRGTSACAAFVHTSDESGLLPSVPDVQLLFLATFQQPDGSRCSMFDLWHSNVFLPAPAVLHPRSRGTVRLNLTAPHAEPVVNINYFADEEDIRTIVRGFQLTMRLVEAMEQSGKFYLDRTPKSECAHSPFASDAYFECLARTFTQTVWHYAGTAKMGREDDASAVVDSQLRVRGVDSLRVVDTSIMPHLPSANIMAPTIMIAEKASDLIKRRHASSAPSQEDIHKWQFLSDLLALLKP